MSTVNTWWVYMLRCADGTLYTGVTTDLKRRLCEHNHCNKKGAKYTRCRRPVVLAHQEPATSRALACQREWQLKQLNKRQKERLIGGKSLPKE